MALQSDAALRAGAEAAVLREPAHIASGERVAVLINVAEPDELAAIDPAICDGIGLVRTEFLFPARRACRTRKRSIGPIARS